MSTTLFSTMIGELAPHVQGVPNPVMVSYIRKVVIDLCERGKVWRVQLADQTLSDGFYTYPLSSPVSNTEVSSIIDAKLYLTSAATTKVLDLLSESQTRQQYPKWPDLNAKNEPRAVTRVDAESFQVAPVPGTGDTYTVKMFAAIRPTLAATGWDTALFSEFRRVIFHGVLHELMLMPNRPWSNDKLSTYHGKQWDYLLYNARAKVNKGFGPASIGVTPRPWA